MDDGLHFFPHKTNRKFDQRNNTVRLVMWKHIDTIFVRHFVRIVARGKISIDSGADRLVEGMSISLGCSSHVVDSMN